METAKKIAPWAGIVLTGLCGIVLLGGGKVMSGTMLTILTFFMLLPAWRRVPLWGRAGLICFLFGVVIWNISTTDLPAPTNGNEMICTSEQPVTTPSTGIKFVDQVTYIFKGFMAQAESS